MKIPIWLAFAVLLSGCSFLNEDVDVNIDCEADQFATDCLDGQRLGCNADREVVVVTCADTLTCKRLTVGGDQKGICAPDCDSGSTSKVCDGNLLLECRGNSIDVTDCGALQCTPTAGMGAECQ